MPPGRNGKNGKLPAAASWYEIRDQADQDSADVYIYDQIGESFFFGGVSAEQLASEIRELNVSTLNVYINSPGGSVFEGLAIMNALRRHPATVHVVVDGLAASAASFIAVGAVGATGTVTMMPNAQMMIHRAMTGVRGNAADLEEMAEFLRKQDANIADVYARGARRRGVDETADYWLDLMDAETWLSDAEAVEFGLADSVREDDGSDDAEAMAAHSERARAVMESFRYTGRDDAPDPKRPAATAAEDGGTPAADVPETPRPAFDLSAVFRNAMKGAAQ